MRPWRRTLARGLLPALHPAPGSHPSMMPMEPAPPGAGAGWGWGCEDETHPHPNLPPEGEGSFLLDEDCLACGFKSENGTRRCRFVARCDQACTQLRYFFSGAGAGAASPFSTGLSAAGAAAGAAASPPTVATGSHFPSFTT